MRVLPTEPKSDFALSPYATTGSAIHACLRFGKVGRLAAIGETCCRSWPEGSGYSERAVDKFGFEDFSDIQYETKNTLATHRTKHKKPV